MKVLTVIGTRPEAIKMAPVLRALQSDQTFSSLLCVTGQHREMLDQALAMFNLTPDIDLNVMQPGQTLGQMTSAILQGVDTVLKMHAPDLVLVHGDTTTAFASTLAAFYASIPVGHIEAGMRTGNLKAPFPEELNRMLIDTMASYYFAPTKQNVQNLIREGKSPEHIVETGNTVIDTVLEVAQSIITPTEELQALAHLLEKRFILVTGHRRESFGAGFQSICEALKTIALTHPDVHIIYPVHLNPRVQQPVYELLSDIPNIRLIAPLSYHSFVYLMKKSYLILTDSGGIQEEGPSLGKPVLVMRDVTERPEAISSGGVRLVGIKHETIVHAVETLLVDKHEYAKMAVVRNVYGDGRASQKIASFLKTLR